MRRADQPACLSKASHKLGTWERGAQGTGMFLNLVNWPGPGWRFSEGLRLHLVKYPSSDLSPGPADGQIMDFVSKLRRSQKEH